jgi:NADPH:quinone reductase-like Zn-dependent oxidoreductase
MSTYLPTFFLTQSSTISATDCEVRRGEWSDVRLTPFIVPGVAFVGRIHKSEKRSAFQSLQPGDLVMSLVKSGSNARFMCAPRDQLVKVPNNVDPTLATCLPETYLSAFQALHLGQKSGMRYRTTAFKGKSILVLGGATALGVALIELALAGGADQVYATSREKQFESLCYVGAIPLSRDPQDWLTLIGNKISTIVCVDSWIHTESVTSEHLKALTKDGQVVVIGAPGIETTAINMSAANPTHLMCASSRNKLRDRSRYYNVFDQWGKDLKLCKRDLTHLVELLQKRVLCPDVLERIPLSKVAKAQSIVETKRLSGFIVCDPWLIKEKLI